MTKERALTPPSCNFCNKPLLNRFVDMAMKVDGFQKTVEKNQHSIPTYICDYFFLVQADNRISSDSIDLEYITSYSPVWLHAMREYTNGIFEKMELNSDGFSVELVNHGICAEQNCILPACTLTRRDVHSFIEMYGKSDRIICHNEMAYARNINDFVAAIKLLLKPEGTLTVEFPHLLSLMEGKKIANLVTGIVTYFSFTTIDIIFKNHKLVIYDVEDCLPEGCLRISAKHQENVSRHISYNTPALRGRERDKGMSSIMYYQNFKDKMERQPMSCERL